MPSTGRIASPIDISRCEHEPVRIPGGIQPHGALLVLRAGDLSIVGSSDNTLVVLGVAPCDLLGRQVTCLAQVADVGRLSSGLRQEHAEDDNPFKVSIHGGRRLNAIVRRQGDRVLVELEHEDDAPEFRTSYVFNRVRQSLVRLRAAADLGELCRRAAREVRELTGFDRVIVYTFRPDWSGRVVAEDCVDGAARYLDLRFPASDIPSQARALYAECRLRMIPTSTYVPARILMSEEGPPIDLTHASLRSISPVHLEYMRNMGVTGSLGISIMVGDRLWGLITCNHESGKRFVPYEARAACGLLGEIVSSLVAQKEGVAVAEGRASYLARQARIVQLVVQDRDLVSGLTEHTPSLLDVTDSTGAVLLYKNELHAIGKTPPRSELTPLLSWIRGQGGGTVATDSLPERYAPAYAWKDVGCGLAATPVLFPDSGGEAGQDTWLLWFRPEVVQTVSWGGDPRKASSAMDAERLHPRKSFERWREEVHLKSIPFEPREIAAAESLSSELVDVVLEIEASRRVREQSAAAAEEAHQRGKIETATSVLHDLGNALTGIGGAVVEARRHAADAAVTENLARTVGFLKPSTVALDRLLGGSRGQSLVALLEAMAVASERGQRGALAAFARVADYLTHANEILSIQRSYASAGSDGARGRVRINRVLADVRAMASGSVEARGGVLTVEPTAGPAPTVRVDRSRLMSVLLNLAKNAAEALDDLPAGRSPWVTLAYVRAPGGGLVITVRDGGRGFDQDVATRLFDDGFSTKQRGSGIGLGSCRRIVESLGGRITVSSEGVGTGARAEITLPKGAIVDEEN